MLHNISSKRFFKIVKAVQRDLDRQFRYVRPEFFYEKKEKTIVIVCVCQIFSRTKQKN
jgi:hypothetical protein